MPSTMPPKIERDRRRGLPVRAWWVGVPLGALLVLGGCAHVPNHFREDGPSVAADWDTPTARAVYARVELPKERPTRPWELLEVAPADGAVTHWPLYLEDPFVDKGSGRTDATDPHNVHRLGWEDYVAFPYCFARFTANWLLLPVSAAVTPPWTLMESDGRISKQLVWYDHDAAPAGRVAEKHEAPDSPAAPDAAEPPADVPSGQAGS